MWLPRCTESSLLAAVRRSAIALVTCALVGGCASSGPSERAAAAAEQGTGRVVSARAQTLYEQAAAAMAAGDHTDAELRFGEFLLQFPDYPGAHVNLAIIHTADGDDASADASIAKALAIDAGYAPALNQLGILRRREGRFDDAEAAYLKAVGADPDYALPHYNLGVLYELYQQQLEPALKHFEIYQSLTDNDEEVSKWIADLKRRIGANQRTANVTE